MRLRDLEKHLGLHGCVFLREGSRHTVYVNPRLNKISVVSRHREIKRRTVINICKDLEIPLPAGF